MAVIKLKNLRLRTIIGVFDFEREHKQDIIINLALMFNDEKPAKTDNLDDTLDYKALKKKIIDNVERSNFNLLEKLSDFILDLVMEDPKVIKAKVEIDKPGALRFVDSVSITKVRRAKR